MKFYSVALANTLLLLSGSLVDTHRPGSCGTISAEARQCCLGNMEVPQKHQQLFVDGSQKAIDIVYSQAFANYFTQYVAALPPKYKNNSPWHDVNAPQVVQALRQRLCGLTITTYGGISGLWVKTFYGNIAYDGEGAQPNTPIRINRWGLANRDAADVANTIAHEAAHRVGLTHPSSDKNLSLANCEPPYIIGRIVEALARGKQWDNEDLHCYEAYEARHARP